VHGFQALSDTGTLLLNELSLCDLKRRRINMGGQKDKCYLAIVTFEQNH